MIAHGQCRRQGYRDEVELLQDVDRGYRGRPEQVSAEAQHDQREQRRDGGAPTGVTDDGRAGRPPRGAVQDAADDLGTQEEEEQCVDRRGVVADDDDRAGAETEVERQPEQDAPGAGARDDQEQEDGEVSAPTVP